MIEVYLKHLLWKTIVFKDDKIDRVRAKVSLISDQILLKVALTGNGFNISNLELKTEKQLISAFNQLMSLNPRQVNLVQYMAFLQLNTDYEDPLDYARRDGNSLYLTKGRVCDVFESVVHILKHKQITEEAFKSFLKDACTAPRIFVEHVPILDRKTLLNVKNTLGEKTPRVYHLKLSEKSILQEIDTEDQIDQLEKLISDEFEQDSV